MECKHLYAVLFFIILSSGSDGRVVDSGSYENEIEIGDRRLPSPEELAYDNFMKRIRSFDYGLPARITGSVAVPKIYGSGRSDLPPFNIESFIEQNLNRRKQNPEPSKRFYYAHPLEEFRYEYQPLVRQTYDGEPEGFEPLSWRANRGFGFNEWGAQPIL